MLLISSFYANTNYDNPEVDREKIIKDVESQFAGLIHGLYEPAIKAGPDMTDIKADPFFNAMNVPGAHLAEDAS